MKSQAAVRHILTIITIIPWPCHRGVRLSFSVLLPNTYNVWKTWWQKSEKILFVTMCPRMWVVLHEYKSQQWLKCNWASVVWTNWGNRLSVGEILFGGEAPRTLVKKFVFGSIQCEWVSEQFLNGTSAEYRLQCFQLHLKTHQITSTKLNTRTWKVESNKTGIIIKCFKDPVAKKTLAVIQIDISNAQGSSQCRKFVNRGNQNKKTCAAGREKLMKQMRIKKR